MEAILWGFRTGLSIWLFQVSWKKGLDFWITLQTLQYLMALLLLTGHVAHLKTHDVLKHVLVYLVLNVKQWLLKDVLDVVRAHVRVGWLLACEGSQVLEQGAHVLRLRSQLL